jgi:diphosphomevalonate decarboxylase
LNKVRGNCSLENPLSFHVRIKTTNSFPTACGLASSASGFACLAICLAEAFGYKGDVSELARLGSGSACRSCYGGFVKWTSSDKSDQSISTRLFPSEHWPDFNILALILEDERKKV